MADPSQALSTIPESPPPPPRAGAGRLKVVWMYQHPSNRPLYRHYGEEHTAILEEAWQRCHNYEGPNYTQIQLPGDNGGTVAAVVTFLPPMTQLSPSTGIRRNVKRYLEEEYLVEGA